MNNQPNEINQENESEEKFLQPNFFIIIPAPVMGDKELSSEEKILYGYLNALTSKFGYCFASDQYLADLTQCCIQEVQKRIKKLEDQGHISRKSQKQGFIWKRKIFCISNNTYDLSEELMNNKKDNSNNSYEHATRRVRERHMAGSEDAPRRTYKDSTKERYVNNTTTNTTNVKKSLDSHPKQKATKPLHTQVVVFSCLEKLNLSQEIKEKVSKDFTEEEIKTAVKRTLLFKSRKSDPGSFLHFLYKPEEYQELISKEEKAQKEQEEINKKIEHNKEIAREFLKEIEKSFTVNSYAYLMENAFWFTKNEKIIALGFSENNFDELMLKYGNWLKS